MQQCSLNYFFQAFYRLLLILPWTVSSCPRPTLQTGKICYLFKQKIYLYKKLGFWSWLLYCSNSHAQAKNLKRSNKQLTNIWFLITFLIYFDWTSNSNDFKSVNFSKIQQPDIYLSASGRAWISCLSFCSTGPTASRGRRMAAWSNLSPRVAKRPSFANNSKLFNFIHLLHPVDLITRLC